jgi:hypothetical protein
MSERFSTTGGGCAAETADGCVFIFVALWDVLDRSVEGARSIADHSP